MGETDLWVEHAFMEWLNLGVVGKTNPVPLLTLHTLYDKKVEKEI